MCLKIVATGKLKRAYVGRVLRNDAPPLVGGGAAALRRGGASVRTQSSAVDSGSTSGKRAGDGFASRDRSMPAVGDTFGIFASFGGGGTAAAAGACDESVCSGVSSAPGSEAFIYDRGGASQGSTSVASYASVARGVLSATSAGFVGSGALAGGADVARRYGLGDDGDGPGVMPMGMLTKEELEAELAKATITFDDETSQKPLSMPLLPSATRLSHVAEFDGAVFWLLRGAGDNTRGPEFMPGLQASQVTSQIYNTVHEAAIRGWDYPFPVEMTDFVVLAICSSGRSILPRKWVAKMTKMAILAKMAKITQKAWVSIISDLWGDLSRSFCIRRAIRAHLGALQLGFLKHGRKPSVLTKMTPF